MLKCPTLSYIVALKLKSSKSITRQGATVDDGVAGQPRFGEVNLKVAHIVSPQSKEAKIHIHVIKNLDERHWNPFFRLSVH